MTNEHDFDENWRIQWMKNLFSCNYYLMMKKKIEKKIEKKNLKKKFENKKRLSMIYILYKLYLHFIQVIKDWNNLNKNC